MPAIRWNGSRRRPPERPACTAALRFIVARPFRPPRRGADAMIGPMTANQDETRREARPRRAPRPVGFRLGPQEFIKKGLSRFDPHDPYYFAVSLSWSRFFLVFVGAELAINTLFAALYTLQPGAIANQPKAGFVSAFFFSLETLATVGYGEMYPATLYGHVVSGVEILVGVIFTAIMTGLLFVRFSKPKAKIHYARNPVVTLHNGRPTLMLRIGNARMTMLHDAQVRLYHLARTISDEGQPHANIAQLPLVRDRFPVFAILWTVMHVIDEDSPLHALLADSDSIAGLRFFFTVAARDPAIGQGVSDIHTFTGSEIRFGMRYVDAIHAENETRIVADYAQLSTIEPDVLPRAQLADRGVQVD